VSAIEAWCRQNKVIVSAELALAGATEILNEAISNDSDVLKQGRIELLKNGVFNQPCFTGVKKNKVKNLEITLIIKRA